MADDLPQNNAKHGQLSPGNVQSSGNHSVVRIPTSVDIGRAIGARLEPQVELINRSMQAEEEELANASSYFWTHIFSPGSLNGKQSEREKIAHDRGLNEMNAKLTYKLQAELDQLIQLQRIEGDKDGSDGEAQSMRHPRSRQRSCMLPPAPCHNDVVNKALAPPRLVVDLRRCLVQEGPVARPQAQEGRGRPRRGCSPQHHHPHGRQVSVSQH